MAIDVYAPTDSSSGQARETLELIDDLRRYEFRDRDDLYAEIDRVLYSDFPVEIPEAYRKTALEIHSPLPLHITNTVAAALSTNPASVQFRPVGFGDAHQLNATAREHFFEASWERQQEESQRRLLRLFIYSLVSKGEGILKTQQRKYSAWGSYYSDSAKLEKQLRDYQFDRDAQDRIYHQKTEEMKLGLPYPIYSTDVPPETFYYTINENGYTGCFEVKQLPYYECLSQFGAGLDQHGRIISPRALADVDPRSVGLARAGWSETMNRAATSTITCIETWDWQHQMIMLVGPGDGNSRSASIGNATLVRKVQHRYGDPILKVLRGPYFRALGTTTASRLPDRAGLGVLFGFLRLFPLLDGLLTMQGNSAFMTGFPAFKRTLPPGSIPGIPESQQPLGRDGNEVSAGEPIVPGEIYPFDVAPIEMPKAGSDADKLIENVQTMIKLAMPDVIQGMSSDASGYALNQAAHLARLAWDPIVANAQTALGQRVGFESWLIENCIGEAVYAWGEQQQKGRSRRAPTKAGWLKIDPSDLNGIHRYQVRLDPETPSNKVIEVRALIEQMNARLITYEDAVTENGANPDEVELSWYTQDLKKSPQMIAMVQGMALKKIGTIVAARMNAAGIDATDLMGGGGGAGLPGVTPTGTPPGLPGPNLNQLGAPPPNPVPSPGAGLPLAPPPPGGGGGGMPPGGIPIQPGPVSGMPVVPNVPSGALPLPGQR